MRDYERGAETPEGGGRAAHIFEQTRRLQLANDETEGRLVNFEGVQQVVMAIVTIFNAQLDGVAGRVASGDSVLRNRLFKEMRRVRSATADRLAEYAKEIEDRVEKHE